MTLQLGSITFHNVTVHVSLLEKDPIFSLDTMLY